MARDLVVKQAFNVDRDDPLGNNGNVDDGAAGKEPVVRLNRLVAAVRSDADGYWLDVRL